MIYQGIYCGNTDVTLKVETFGEDLPVALQLYDAEGPFAALTKNFGNSGGNGAILNPFLGWLDLNNCPEAEEFIRRYRLGEPYRRFGEPVVMYSGFCAYPLYQFFRSELSRLDPEGTEEYEEMYRRNAEKARKRLLGGSGR